MWVCGSFYLCICVVIVWEGNDVVEVDNCEKRVGVVEVFFVLFLIGYFLEGIIVSWDNKIGKIFNVCNIFLLFCMKMI